MKERDGGYGHRCTNTLTKIMLKIQNKFDYKRYTFAIHHFGLNMEKQDVHDLQMDFVETRKKYIRTIAKLERQNSKIEVELLVSENCLLYLAYIIVYNKTSLYLFS